MDVRAAPPGRGDDAPPVALARVVVVESRPEGRVAALLIGDGGLSVETTDDDTRAGELAAAFDPHLIVLEVEAITAPVEALCANLEAATGAPVMLFCDRADEGSVIAGFAAGARTVVVEPIGTHELVARVRALLRRTRTHDEPVADVLTVGPVVLDRARRVITVRGEVVTMPRREFEIAELLMQHAGALVGKQKILRALWGSTSDAKSLAVQVGRLRARLAAVEGYPRILTVRGLGYRFVSDEDLALERTAIDGGTFGSRDGSEA